MREKRWCRRIHESTFLGGELGHCLALGLSIAHTAVRVNERKEFSNHG